MAKKETNNYLPILFAVFVLLLTFINLTQIFAKKEVKVLGTKIEDSSVFWQDFLKKHPTYRDAWVELDRMDMVKRIDPNFIP